MYTIKQFRDNIYAGVLGKIIGVYMGRPVEGWPFSKINSQFGEVNYYKNHKTGAPLIVPDDDISGTFVFFRALEDNNYDPNLTAEAIGEAWLNYLVEDKTVLWWGGLCRSTEHTAYLRLKSGIKAPKSGSIEINGRSMAEQIGAEIFIDSWALANPANPKRATEFAKRAASVSHDGIAIDAAVYLAALESLAFIEKDVNKLLDEAFQFISNDDFKHLIDELREHCDKAHNWYEVRQWIANNHGYDKYPGNCPMITNHLTLLMSFIMGGDDFHKSVMIATSAGWDTDCNAGNIGCLNGIRLGLSGFSTGSDLRKPVADRMYVVSADGGACISDAVLETRKIYKAASILNDESASIPKARYAFEYPGSVQGLIAWNENKEEQVLTDIKNTYQSTGEYGCEICFAGLGVGVHAAVAVDTFIDLKPKGVEGTSYFDVLCSPSLYSGQTVSAIIYGILEYNPTFNFFIEYFNEDEKLAILLSKETQLIKGKNVIQWEIPDVGGHPIYRLGIYLTSQERLDGSIILKELDWSNTPKEFKMGRSMEMTPSLTPWTTTTDWLKAFVSSADHFNPDYTTTFSICHSESNGVATIGTSDWSDYSVKSVITFSQQDLAGLVARAKGHKQYYGAVFSDGYALIYKQMGGHRVEIAKKPFDYKIDSTYDLKFVVKGIKLSFIVDGREILCGSDSSYSFGQAGFIVESGAILADGFEVKAV